MNDTDKGLKPLFDRANRDGLWFYCGYQDLWFSPAQLAAEQERGNFRWGAVNWTLRDPRERVAELRREAERATNEAERFETLIARRSERDA